MSFTDTHGHTHSDAVSRLPLFLQLSKLTQEFERAKTVADFTLASERWAKLRMQMKNFEKEVCEKTGAKFDREIGIDLFEGLLTDALSAFVKMPELLLAVGKLVVSVAGQEEEQFVESVKKVGQELAKEMAHATLHDIAHNKKIMRLAEELKGAIAGYLKGLQRRSPKHLKKLANLLFGSGKVKLPTGAIVKLVDLMTTSSRITPDECTMMKDVSRAQDAAFLRIFKSSLPSATSLPQTKSSTQGAQVGPPR